MKNKLLIASLATFSLFALASCGGKGDDYSSLREVVLSDIDASVKTDLNLFYDSEAEDHNAVCLTTDVKTDLIKVYVAKDAKASLFVYNVDIKNIFEEHKEKSKTLNISAVSSTGAIYESEQTTILTTLFASENGIKSHLEGFDLKDSIYDSSTYTKSVDITEEYKKYVENNDSVAYLSIVYIPTFVVHTIDGQDKLRDYVLVPVYHAFTTDGKISDINVVDFAKYLDSTKFKIKESAE